MGEYAIRKKDRQKVKIGVTEDFCYIRYDQINQVKYNYSWLNCFFRIPTPDEDGTEPGEFEPSLLQNDGRIPWHLLVDESKLSKEDKEDLAKDTSIIQLHHDYGLLVNVQCYHGFDLPKGSKDICCFYNGRRDHLMFAFLKPTEEELLIGIQCAACRKMWSMPYEEAIPLFRSLWMKVRLFHQCAEYWMEKHAGMPPTYVATGTDNYDNVLTIRAMGIDFYQVEVDGEDKPLMNGTWAECRDYFVGKIKENYEGEGLKLRYLPDYETKHK